MGVFARFRRRKPAAPTEASTDETAACARTEDPAAPAGDAAPEAADRTAGEPAPEGVGIPKQQSADEAADSETGEGART